MRMTHDSYCWCLWNGRRREKRFVVRTGGIRTLHAMLGIASEINRRNTLQNGNGRSILLRRYRRPQLCLYRFGSLELVRFCSTRLRIR